MSKKEIFIPESLMETLVEKYRGGITLIELHREYNIPYDVLARKLNPFKINIHDFMSECLGKIVSAEKKLICGTFPNYQLNMDIKTAEDYNKYKSLLWYYSTSDLNSKSVHFSKNLLS